MTHLLAFQILPLCGLLCLCLWLAESLAPGRIAALFGRRLWMALAVLLLALYAACVAFVATLPMVVDAVEATVASTSALWLRGEPLYTSLDAASRYSLLYGPMCYAPFALALRLLGESLTSLKIAVVAINAALFLTLWMVFRRKLIGMERLIALAFIAAGLMMKGMSTFMVRGDAALGLAIALSLLAVTLPSRWLSIALFVTAGAIALDIKFTSVFYLMVPFYFGAARWGRWVASASACAIPLVAVIPFAFRTVSLRNYIAWIDEASKHPLSAKLLAMNAVAAAILLAPVAIMFWRFHRAEPERARLDLRRRWLLAAYFAASILGGMLTGSKLGAGRSHLNPGFILAAYLAALLWSRTRRTSANVRYAFAVYAVVLLVPALSQTRDLWRIGVERRAFANGVNADLDDIVRTHPAQRVEMGYSETTAADTTVDPLALFAPRLVLAGNPDLADAGALFDMGLSKLPIPPATIAALRSCEVQVWLFPRDSAPFELTNTYAFDMPMRFPERHLFNAEFREAFRATYSRTSSGRYYDLWTCR